jgi:hypothetical protein
MFRRLLLEETATLFTVVAFVTAASIYGGIAWRALRMKRAQLDRFARLPFATATPPAVRHEHAS